MIDQRAGFRVADANNAQAARDFGVGQAQAARDFGVGQAQAARDFGATQLRLAELESRLQATAAANATVAAAATCNTNERIERLKWALHVFLVGADSCTTMTRPAH
jgi:hypothetical protein